MGGIAGTFRFDARQPVADELKMLQDGIVSIGPDSQTSIDLGFFGMIRSEFHTSLESTRRTQPLCLDRFIVTFDGRLDNRDEIYQPLGLAEPLNECSDALLAAKAFAVDGLECLARLEGDWALVVWNRFNRETTLARDCMGVRRLFYRIDDAGVSWCSRVEPLLDTAGRTLTLDRQYVADYFTSRPPPHTTPFTEIRSVAPGHAVRIAANGRCKQDRFWSLTENDVSELRPDEDYDEEFRERLTNALRRRMRTTYTVLAELSGGVDSSSIVCVADQVSQKECLPFAQTLSFFDPEEPTGDERPFFQAIESHRGREGFHVSAREVRGAYKGEELAPLPQSVRIATPGYFRKSLVWAEHLADIYRQANARILLSGVGGDELLGGVQDEAPELAQYLADGRPIPFFRSSVAWGVLKRKPVYPLWRSAASLLLSKYIPRIHARSIRREAPEWLLIRPSEYDRSLELFAPWKSLSPVAAAMERDRYYLGAQLTATAPPLVGCIERRYPLLDRDLYRFIARTPREQIVSSSSRRRLMRRALRSVVPEPVLFRKTKWFGYRAGSRGLSDVGVATLFDRPWASKDILDIPMLRRELDASRSGMGDPTLITAAIALEQWLQTLPWKLRLD